uniref:Uncharacterized protein LOC100182814 n=1 Tax=Phallusia mammillata TaxID=59560 RepID=A0A6F9DIE6_9ASCI|nr:uncharacterized protein LOC100182814 [Phallusia mammillata]
MKRNFNRSCIPSNDDQSQNASTSGQHLASTSNPNQPFHPHRHPLNFHLPRNPYNTPHSNQAVPYPQQTGPRNRFNAAAARGSISNSQQFQHQTSWNTRPTYSYANQQHYAAVRQAQTWTQPCPDLHHIYHRHENTQMNIPQNLSVYPSHISTQQIYNPHSIGHQHLNQLPYLPNLIQSGVHDDVAHFHQNDNQQSYHASSFGATSNDNNLHLNSAQQSQPSTADHPAQQAMQHFQAAITRQKHSYSSITTVKKISIVVMLLRHNHDFHPCQHRPSTLGSVARSKSESTCSSTERLSESSCARTLPWLLSPIATEQ